jgi:hypothetical protein
MYPILFSAREIAALTGFSGFQLAYTKHKPILVKKVVYFLLFGL